jgi:hypothetical protein
MEASEAMRLSKQEALSIFSFLEIGYSQVLEQKFEIVKLNRSDNLLTEMKRLLLVVRIWKTYKSDKIRNIVQDTTELFIKDIYQDENRKLSINDLTFMIPFVFSFRHVHSKKQLRQIKHNESYMKCFRKSYREVMGSGI